MYPKPECEVSPWKPRTVSHATFTEAMAMLGIDVGDLMGLTIGNWQDEDVLMWPWATVMKEDRNNLWRIKYSRSETLTAQGGVIGYIGIDRPVYDLAEDDDESPAAQ